VREAGREERYIAGPPKDSFGGDVLMNENEKRNK